MRITGKVYIQVQQPEITKRWPQAFPPASSYYDAFPLLLHANSKEDASTVISLEYKLEKQISDYSNTIVHLTATDMSTGVIRKSFQNQFGPLVKSANYFLPIPLRAVQSYIEKIPIAMKTCPTCSRSTFYEGWDCPYCHHRFTHEEMMTIEDNIRKKEISFEVWTSLFNCITEFIAGVFCLVSIMMFVYFSLHELVFTTQRDINSLFYGILFAIGSLLPGWGAYFLITKGIHHYREVKKARSLLLDKEKVALSKGNIAKYSSVNNN
jgi:hypothetical protein